MISNKNEDFRVIIAQAIKDACTEDLKEVKSHFGLKTFSSRHSLSRDIMNTHISRRLDSNRFSVETFNRGAHQFITIYDNNEKTLYSIMKHKTFKGLEKSNKKANVHYLEALGFMNNDNIVEKSQIKFFEYEYRQSQIEDLLFKIVSKEVIDEVKVHKLITFDINNNELSSISVFQLNSELDIINEESWNDYIAIDYDDIGTRYLNIDINEDEYAIEEEISLGIKGTEIEIKVK